PPAVKLRPPRTQTIVALVDADAVTDAVSPPAAGKASLKRAQAEARVLAILAERGPVPVSQIIKLAAITRKAITRLAQRQAVRFWEEPAVAENIYTADFVAASNVLNEDQRRAFREIETWLDAASFTVGLLYGVTGSGKTEVYLRAVAAALARG